LVPQMAIIGFLSPDNLMVLLLEQLYSTCFTIKAMDIGVWSLGAAFLEQALGRLTHDSGMIVMKGLRRCCGMYIQLLYRRGGLLQPGNLPRCVRSGRILSIPVLLESNLYVTG
jgi:hypothetical protein